MKFPLMKNDQDSYPSGSKCAWCKHGHLDEPHSFAVLMAGALYVNRKSGNSRDCDKLDGYLYLIWHGAHDGGIGEFPENHIVIPIAEDVRGGQFSISFCSTKCLRDFLNHAVDKLEEKRAKAQAEDNQS